VENTDLFPQQAEVAEQWNAIYAYPHLQYSGFHEALESIAAQFGDNIPTVKGDGGPYWEDGIASDAFYAAMERETESRGPSAEKLSTISALVNPRVAADKAGLDRMWEKMVLMDEHTFTSSAATSDPSSDETVEQIAVKNSFATEAHGISNRILKSSMATLANSIAADANSLIVFNTLNWPRSALVTWDLESDRELVDRATGNVVPTQLVFPGGRFHRVRFWAQDVPATGYKVYLLRPAKPPAATTPKPETPVATTLENSYYKVGFDPATGAVQSIFDNDLQRELVDSSSPYRFGQYLYVTSQHANFRTSEFEVHPAGQGRLVSVERTPYGAVARLESSALNTPHVVSEIRLYDRDKKIEFIEDVDKQEVYKDEAVYFAFPFAMSHPQFQYEIQNGVVDPSKDMYPGAGFDWFSVQHWVSVQQDGLSATVMPLDAPMITLGDITRVSFPRTFGERKGWIFSYPMDNYWHVNYLPGQGGHFRFRFVITSAPSTDPLALSHKGWEETTPLEMEEITDLDKAISRPEPLDGTQGSFLRAQDPELLLETWKPAEDGNGTILRFLDLGGKERIVAVETPLLNLDHVWRTDSVERNEKALQLVNTHAFNIGVHPHEILTIRVTGTAALSQEE
jgi:alpha-mannosidase